MPPTQRSAKRLTTDRDGPLRCDETTRERSAQLLARYITTGRERGETGHQKGWKAIHHEAIENVGACAMDTHARPIQSVST
jgi:hypothetical protein